MEAVLEKVETWDLEAEVVGPWREVADLETVVVALTKEAVD